MRGERERRVVTVHTTYMELSDPLEFVPSHGLESRFSVRRLDTVPPTLYRYLFDAVGRDYYWDDRLHWTDEMIVAHFARPDVALFVAYDGDEAVGYAELNAESAEPGTEITHIGVISAFQGRGLGKHLLSTVVEYGFARGAPRIWLHTDNFDGPRALQNYNARGFRPYRKTTHLDTIIVR